MKDMKKVEKEIKDELKQASRKSREDMDALKQQVRSEAKEFKKTAGEAFEAHDVEREIRHERMVSANKWSVSFMNAPKSAQTLTEEWKNSENLLKNIYHGIKIRR